MKRWRYRIALCLCVCLLTLGLCGRMEAAEVGDSGPLWWREPDLVAGWRRRFDDPRHGRNGGLSGLFDPVGE